MGLEFGHAEKLFTTSNFKGKFQLHLFDNHVVITAFNDLVGQHPWLTGQVGGGVKVGDRDDAPIGHYYWEG